MSIITKFFSKISLRTLHYSVLGIVSLMVISACSNSKPNIDTALLQKNDSAKGQDYSEVVPATKPVGDDGKTAQNIPMRGGGYAKIGKPYKIDGKWYYPERNDNYAKTGKASWYGEQFHGRMTANGETYDMYHFTAAHPTMPLPSYARVTNMDNGSSMIVRVNDRGPYAKDRIIDLSMQAATMLGYKDRGTANVKVEYVGKAPIDGQDDAYLMASFQMGDEKNSIMQAMFDPNGTSSGSKKNSISSAEAATKSLISTSDKEDKTLADDDVSNENIAYNDTNNAGDIADTAKTIAENAPKTKETANMKKTSKSFFSFFKSKSKKSEENAVVEQVAYDAGNVVSANVVQASLTQSAMFDLSMPDLPEVGPVIATKPVSFY